MIKQWLGRLLLSAVVVTAGVAWKLYDGDFFAPEAVSLEEEAVGEDWDYEYDVDYEEAAADEEQAGREPAGRVKPVRLTGSYASEDRPVKCEIEGAITFLTVTDCQQREGKVVRRTGRININN